MANEIIHRHTNFDPPRAPSEAEIAASLKESIRFELERVCEQLNRVNSAGFVPQFQLGLGPTGKWVIQDLAVVKRF